LNEEPSPRHAPTLPFRDVPFLVANILTFAYVFSYYVFTQFAGLSRIPFVLGSCLALLALVRGLQVGRFRLPRMWYLPLAFVLYAAISLLWVKDTDHALSRMAQIMSAVIGAGSIWLWTYNGLSWRPVVWGAIAGSLVLAGSTVPEVMSEGIHARVAGIALNSNATGILLSFPVFFAWCAPEKSPRWVVWLGVGFLFYAAAFTGSRKVLLCLMAFLALFTITTTWNRKRTATVILALAITISTFALMRDRSGVVETLTSLQIYQRTEKALRGKDRSYRTRIGMYHQALEMWKERPVTGWGVGQFSELSDFASYAHSNYAQLLANLGCIGFVLMYLFYANLLLRAYRGYRSNSRAGQAALVLLLMILALDTGMVSFIGKGSWLLLLFTEGLCSEAERSARSGTAETTATALPYPVPATTAPTYRWPAETG